MQLSSAGVSSYTRQVMLPESHVSPPPPIVPNWITIIIITRCGRLSADAGANLAFHVRGWCVWGLCRCRGRSANPLIAQSTDQDMVIRPTPIGRALPSSRPGKMRVEESKW